MLQHPIIHTIRDVRKTKITVQLQLQESIQIFILLSSQTELYSQFLIFLSIFFKFKYCSPFSSHFFKQVCSSLFQPFFKALITTIYMAIHPAMMFGPLQQQNQSPPLLIDNLLIKQSKARQCKIHWELEGNSIVVSLVSNFQTVQHRQMIRKTQVKNR